MKCVNCKTENKKDICISCEKVTDGIKVGDTITFGRYKQGDYYKKEPVLWRVLDIENNIAMLLSDKTIEYQCFDNTGKRVSWYNCSLASYLNYTFLYEIFSEEEIRKLIVKRDLDKIVVMKEFEINKFLPNEEMRKATPTLFAQNLGAGNSWWLGDNGYIDVIDYSDYYDVTDDNAAFVEEDGTINADGVHRSVKKGVRPVVWVKLGEDGKLNEEDEKALSVGELVYFGKYQQTCEREEETLDNIEWLVLDENEEGFLLMSKFILDHIKYTEKEGCNNESWDTSYARKWLNEDFLNEAFTDVEKNCILDTQLDNCGFGENTIDKVFLLSPSEMEKVIPKNTEREGVLTSRLKHLRACDKSYWLRSVNAKASCYVWKYDNRVIDNYSKNDTDFSIRPVLWVKK